MNDPKEIIREFVRMQQDRATYENAWRDIRILVRPNTVDFGQTDTPGEVRTERMYDGTALQANVDLAAALHSYMVNPAERFFGIEADAGREVNRQEDVLKWCEEVADTIFSEYSDDRSMFTSSVHEAFMDIGSFGNAVVYQEWNADSAHLSFRAFPLSSCYFDEDKNGLVDVLYRTMKMTVRQIKQQFPDATWDTIQKDPDNLNYDVIHAVERRGGRVYGREDAENKAYKSCWVLQQKSVLLKEGGYDSFPYHVVRWSKVADEIYGRGPAINCLPDIRMLNRMELATIKAASKAVDPSLILPSDGFLMPFKTSPGAINYRDPSAGEFEVQALRHEGNFPVTLEITEQKREFIKRCFYSDWVKLMPKKERQTQYEISELVAQQLRMMAPMLGRIYTELLVPMIQRSFELLSKHQRIPEAPEVLSGANYKVTYVSAAARAQTETQAVSMGKFMQELIPLAQIDPRVMDRIDTDAYAEELAYVRKVTRRIIRPDRQVDQMRADRDEEQQAAAMAGAAEPVSKAILNLSQAQKAGGIV